MIDLRSDTVTQPNEEMRQQMAQAPVGDDAYGEDESVNQLQDYCKELFRVEDALFVAGGMMANRLAFLSQTSPGDEVITEASYHVNYFDSAPMSAFANVVLNPQQTNDGILRRSDIEKAIADKQRFGYFAQPKLISLENSINCWAGKIFPYDVLKEIYHFAQNHKIKVHLDGARIFNAHIATGVPLHKYTQNTDTLSVCFSKGLGAPYGSMLMGFRSTISKARKYRVWLGGAGHQMGIYAAAAYYALKHNLKDLEKDHDHAKYFSELLGNMNRIALAKEAVETNMVQFNIDIAPHQSDQFIDECDSRGLKVYFWKPRLIRAVIHRHITKQELRQAVGILYDVLSKHKTRFCRSA